MFTIYFLIAFIPFYSCFIYHETMEHLQCRSILCAAITKKFCNDNDQIMVKKDLYHTCCNTCVCTSLLDYSCDVHYHRRIKCENQTMGDCGPKEALVAADGHCYHCDSCVAFKHKIIIHNK